MRKIINNPTNVVREMLEGLVDLNPDQALMESENIIIRADLAGQPAQVAVISGGGCGHEPAFAGYVGNGMLHAAVAGDVFTSPAIDAILAAIQACRNPKGVLLILNNYTGDRLNFGMAAELARLEGILVEMVIVADDAALRDLVTPDRRRGLAGSALAIKIACAAAASGASLQQVKQEAEDAIANIATMGVALGSCTIPAHGKPGFDLPENEIELGLGLHGEKGIWRTTLKTADELVEILLDKLVTDLAITKGQRVALLINGLGGTPLMELAIISRHALKTLRNQGINVERAWSGNYMTSLEMPGFSLSLIRLNDQRLAKLDYPASAPAWIGDGKIAGQRKVMPSTINHKPEPLVTLPINPRLRQVALNIAAELESAEEQLTLLDSAAGDGDLGLSMSRGARAIRELNDNSWVNELTMLNGIGNAIRRSVGGSSGVLAANGLLAAARYLSEQHKLEPAAIAEAFIQAVNAISQLGGAKANERTMLDALLPASAAFKQAISQQLSSKEALELAVIAAEDGARKTAQMLPQQGRASYLGDRVLGVQDGGAVAVAICLRAILQA